MSDSLTINYSWTMPEVGGSPDTWGTKLNATITAIDAQAKADQTAVTTPPPTLRQRSQRPRFRPCHTLRPT